MEWEIYILEMDINGQKQYKVVRKMKHAYKAEAKIFHDPMEAIEQFEEWIGI
jgi:hypothetical protein